MSNIKKAQEILQQVQGVRGELVGIYDNDDGTKSLVFAYPKPGYEFSEETIRTLQEVCAVSIFNRYDPAYRLPTSQYTSSESPYSEAIKIPQKPHEQIKLARKVIIWEPVVGTVIDILTDLSSAGLKIDCDDTDVGEFYEKFNDEVKMKRVLNWIFREYYLSGNVTVYKETDKDGIPIAYTVLNPEYVYVVGSLLFNSEVVTVDLSNEIEHFKEMIDIVGEDSISGIPKEIIRKIKGKSGNFDGKVPLPREKVSRICRKKMPYERYATPYLTRIFEPVMRKQKLKQMDVSTIEGIINQLLIVTIGDENHPPTEKQLKAVAKLFTTPKKAYTVVWDYTLKVEVVTPKGLETLTNDKYDAVNDDISKGLGIPSTIIDGTGANYSTAFVAVLSFIERVSREIEEVKMWLEDEYKKIAELKGFKTVPKVRFDKTQLRQEMFIRQVLTPLYDRGLISEETALTEAGYDYYAELEKKKKNIENRKYFLPPTLPYTGQPSNPLDHQGREPGKPSEDYKERDIEQEPSTGPKYDQDPKQTMGARNAELLQSQNGAYLTVFDEHYWDLKEKIAEAVEQQEKEEDESKQAELLASIFAGFVMSAYDDTIRIMNLVYDTVYRDIVDDETKLHDVRYGEYKQKLQDWHLSALNKFANDIKTEVQKGERSLDDIFDSNAYRVKLFANEGVINADRYATIAGFKVKGVAMVKWNAIVDDNTCEVCLERNGKVYTLSMLPLRPHVNCRCWFTSVEEEGGE